MYLSGKYAELKIMEIEPIEIELRTSDNKTVRKTNDRNVAHKAVDMFFDFHEAEWKEKSIAAIKKVE
jgi:hypothetical protein